MVAVHQCVAVLLNLQVSKLKAVTERSSVADTGVVCIHLVSLQLACDNIFVSFIICKIYCKPLTSNTKERLRGVKIIAVRLVLCVCCRNCGVYLEVRAQVTLQPHNSAKGLLEQKADPVRLFCLYEL